MSSLADQIRQALTMFAQSGTEPALIGGLAVVAHQVVRATKDVDFLVEAQDSDKIHDALLGLGYQCTYLTNQNCSMNFLPNSDTQTETDKSTVNADALLVREAGVPFQPPLGAASGIDPFVEWLSLMEVVQMLCPTWPVREKPMQGTNWRL